MVMEKGIFANLLARLETLEKRPTLKYLGTYDPDTQYQQGDFVTHSGSLWHCKSACQGQKPPNTNWWQLAVKHGRDGKNAQPKGPTVR
jgi:hypothetical protein